MKKKHRRIKKFLLLIIALQLPGSMVIQANDGTSLETEQASEVETTGEKRVSSNSDNEENVLQMDMCSEEKTEVYDTIVLGEDEEDEGIVSSDTDNCKQKETIDETVSSDTVLSDNQLSLEETQGKDSTVSHNQSLNSEIQKDIFNVVLPTEIPFDIVLWEGEESKGAVFSKRFYIENKGDEDICVSLKGVCEGENQEDYIISNTSVENKLTPNKKNVWMYLKWEDKNGQDLELPPIMMGDSVNPGQGKIILKAPVKGSEGENAGDNFESKAYFSFRGELNSDKGAWKSDELKAKLNFSMEVIDSGKSDGLLESKDSEGKSTSTGQDISFSLEKTNDTEKFSSAEDVLEESISKEDSLQAMVSPNMENDCLIDPGKVPSMNASGVR